MNQANDLSHRTMAVVISACLSFAACDATSRSRPVANKPLPLPASNFNDTDNDGFPDEMELITNTARENFRAWFTSIAEMQFYRLSDEWNKEQRDCAGLVRFSMREALRPHDRLWFQKMGVGYESVAPDVRGINLEKSPLHDKLFRVDFGAFKESDLTENKFSEFADARTLKNYNVTFISRERSQAQAGDLLFYEQAFAQKFPYHVMIFIGKARQADEGANDWVVYHTGNSASDEGTLKKVRLSVLDHHPDPRWRPVMKNKNFLGFFRLKILL
jgi:uncharacterized protein